MAGGVVALKLEGFTDHLFSDAKTYNGHTPQGLGHQHLHGSGGLAF